MYNYKKWSLYVILDAYATKNAIEYFLKQDWTSFKNAYINKYKDKERASKRLEKEIERFKKELEEIEDFLNDENNLHWSILGVNREIFDKNLPKYRRRIEWFRSTSRYPFDYSVFFSSTSDNPCS